MIGVVWVDDEDGESRVIPDPTAFTPVSRCVDQDMIAFIIKPHRCQAYTPIWPDQAKGDSDRSIKKVPIDRI